MEGPQTDESRAAGRYHREGGGLSGAAVAHRRHRLRVRHESNSRRLRRCCQSVAQRVLTVSAGAADGTPVIAVRKTAVACAGCD